MSQVPTGDDERDPGLVTALLAAWSGGETAAAERLLPIVYGELKTIARNLFRHERGDHYLADPGGQDVTTEVALDQLPPPDAVRSQAQWLRRWGIDELVAEGKRV